MHESGFLMSREVVFKPGLRVYNATFKTPSQCVSDSVSPGESRNLLY